MRSVGSGEENEFEIMAFSAHLDATLIVISYVHKYVSA